jgi:hypothetical protein
MKPRFSRLLLWVGVGLVGLCLAAAGVSALVNLGLPAHSNVPSRLSDREKFRLIEANALRKALGDSVWPGWSALDIPFTVYNEEYAFVAFLYDPASGWQTPLGQQRGGPWEWAEDCVYGQAYYRQRLADPEVNPQNFIAQIGTTWTVSMQTEEYSQIAFVKGFRDELPPVVQAVFPYSLAWNTIVGEMDGSIATLMHESFHVFEATRALSRLQSAERANRLEKSYPFTDEAQRQAWKTELDLLVQAVRAPGLPEARDLARRYLAARQARQATLSSDLVGYEREREWLEGLAKYAELSISKAAASGYTPSEGITYLSDFHHYANRPQFYEQQLEEVRRMDTYEGEVRFYYSGFAQAALLDRLLPGWKDKVFADGVYLDGLLSQAIQ